MYSEDDLNSAVAAGALSADAARNFRTHVSRMRELPHQSEESFKFLNSFNDIFVSIGIVILLVAVGAIGQALGQALAPVPPLPEWDFSQGPRPLKDADWLAYKQARDFGSFVQMLLAGALVAVTAWPLAEFFTRRRRMALPSILLLVTFVGGVFFALLGAGMAIAGVGENSPLLALALAAAALGAALAAFVHWRRFMVPITVAAGTGTLGASIIALVLFAIGPDNVETNTVLALVFAAGLAVFAFAMRWDMSDLERITRRSDVAFWLHLLAAPLIAHPVFALIGVTGGNNIGLGAAFGVLGVYVAFGLLALAIDRRALLVSALAYVLFALTFLFREFGAVELGFALTALVIGSALLSLSAFWQPIRAGLVNALPEAVRARLPATTEAGALPVAAQAV